CWAATRAYLWACERFTVDHRTVNLDGPAEAMRAIVGAVIGFAYGSMLARLSFFAVGAAARPQAGKRSHNKGANAVLVLNSKAAQAQRHAPSVRVRRPRRTPVERRSNSKPPAPTLRRPKPAPTLRLLGQSARPAACRC